MFQEFPRIHKSIQQCNENEKFSFVNLLMFPEKLNKDSWASITQPQKNTKVEVYFTDTQYLVGGYIAEILDGYQVIYLKEIVLNPKLKSVNYTREMIYDVCNYGLDVFGENFKGVVATSQCLESKKSLDSKNKFKIRALINAGGKIVVECARVKNQILHLIYVPYNGGLEQNEVKEIFRKITHL